MADIEQEIYYPKVLVGSPVNKVKDYVLWKWLVWVKSLTYPNFSIFLSDNSIDEEYHKEINKIVECRRVNPLGKNNMEYICESHNMVREFALQNNFDYLLHLECDIFPPLNIIEHLIDTGKTIINAPYHYDLGEYSRLLLIDMEKSGLQKKANTLTNEQSQIFLDGNVKPIYSAGLGCTLIHKSALAKFPFRVVKGQNVHADSFFALDVHNSGIRQFVDTNILCRHLNEGWSHISKRV